MIISYHLSSDSGTFEALSNGACPIQVYKGAKSPLEIGTNSWIWMQVLRAEWAWSSLIVRNDLQPMHTQLSINIHKPVMIDGQSCPAAASGGCHSSSALQCQPPSCPKSRWSLRNGRDMYNPSMNRRRSCSKPFGIPCWTCSQYAAELQFHPL